MNSGRSRIQCPVCKEKISRHTLITVYQDWPVPGAEGASSIQPQPPRDPSESSTSKRALALLENQIAALIEETETLKKQNQQLLASNEQLSAQALSFEATLRQKEELLCASRKEKEQLSQRLVLVEQDLQRHRRDLTKLRLKFNIKQGLESIAKLGECDEESASTMLKNFTSVGAEQQLRLFCALEQKCRELVNHRKSHFKLFQEEKKKLFLAQEQLRELQHTNLLLEKEIEARSNYQAKPSARPSPFSTPEPKLPRIANTNPFLRRVNPVADQTPVAFDIFSESQKPLKRSRSFRSESRTDLGDGLQSLSLDPDVIVIDDSPTLPVRRRLNPCPNPKKASCRDIHGFFT
ncbi:hypothetical protein L0F63_001930 [Massospora cicadina]|nr:hypothetical protein L0F63_001930 [Massospora cicadina]